MFKQISKIYKDKKVEVITNENKLVKGVLKSIDQHLNIVMTECYEQGVEEEQQTFQDLLLIRGDTICTIAEINQDFLDTFDTLQSNLIPLQMVDLMYL